MRFGLYSLLALVPAALAMPVVEARQASGSAGVVAGIKQLEADAKTLDATVNKLKVNDPGALFVALKVQQQTATLSNDLKAVTKVAQASQPFTDEGSGDIASAVIEFSPVVEKLLNDIVKKKPAFATAFLFVGDLSQTVLKSLKDQQQLTKTFSAVVTNKLAEPYKSLAPSVTGPINDNFQKAIAAYQKCTGKICLPPIG